jgi:hypothetical protein
MNVVCPFLNSYGLVSFPFLIFGHDGLSGVFACDLFSVQVIVIFLGLFLPLVVVSSFGSLLHPRS